jgi:hypothetical protein
MRKPRVTLKLDSDLLAWFHATGPGWNGLINDIFRSWYDAHKDDRSLGAVNGIGGHTGKWHRRRSHPVVTLDNRSV